MRRPTESTRPNHHSPSSESCSDLVWGVCSERPWCPGPGPRRDHYRHRRRLVGGALPTRKPLTSTCLFAHIARECPHTLAVHCEEPVRERLARPWLWVISGLIESAEGQGNGFHRWRGRMMAGPSSDCSLVIYWCTRTRSPHPPPWPNRSFPFQLKLTACSWCTGVPIHTCCILHIPCDMTREEDAASGHRYTGRGCE